MDIHDQNTNQYCRTTTKHSPRTYTYSHTILSRQPSESSKRRSRPSIPDNLSSLTLSKEHLSDLRVVAWSFMLGLALTEMQKCDSVVVRRYLKSQRICYMNVSVDV